MDDGQNYVPAIYTRFRANHPEVASAYDALSDAMHRGGPLTDRDRRMVRLGIAIGAGSEGAVRSQVRKALAEGATTAEVEHAILLGLTTLGLPATVAAFGWASAVLDR
ncbi:MAG: carboxymuconolactone decarboxylase family protein [Chloroflexi bacterium]|nr:carboxymuconolactone decarboxylase family protein [Chloroflexota bacterium]